MVTTLEKEPKVNNIRVEMPVVAVLPAPEATPTRRILIVEDNQVAGRQLQHLLQSDPQLEVDVTADGDGERGGQPASAAEDGRDAHRRRKSEHRGDCERLPERGLRLRRHQDEQGEHHRPGRSHQRRPVWAEDHRRRPARAGGEQRVRPRHRRERVRRLRSIQPP